MNGDLRALPFPWRGRGSACALLLGGLLLVPPLHADFVLDRIVFDVFPLSAPTDASAFRATPTLAPGPPPQAPSLVPAPITGMAAARDASLADFLPDGEDPAGAVSGYLDRIDTPLDTVTPYDHALFDQHLALGLSYQAAGDHEKALEAFAHAEYLSRIDKGLFAPEQFPLNEHMIDSYLAQGDLRHASERRQYLFRITRLYYGEDSLELVSSLATLADWNMIGFDVALKAGNNVGFVSGGRGIGTRELTPRGLAFPSLYRAQAQYYQAVANLVNHRRIVPAQLIPLEMKLVEAVFLGANRRGILEDPVFYLDRPSARSGMRVRLNELRRNTLNYQNGHNAFQRMQIYQRLDPTADAIARVLPLVGSADWDLLFQHDRLALQQYREAAEQLRQQGGPAAVAAVLNPVVPVQLPEFAPRPNSRRQFGIAADSALEYAGWIDVSFRVSRFGSVSKVRFLGGSENVTDELKRRLGRVLHHGKFRPRVDSLQTGDSETISLRYYFLEV